MSDVKLLARWVGWCDPCETDRPLVLTEAGERGLRAWLRGVGAEDRSLTLTCGVCGEWQAVTYDESDEPVEAPQTVIGAIQPVGARSITVMWAKPPAYVLHVVPSPRAATNPADPSLDLLPHDVALATA